jgi:hypothetical protein
VPEDPDLRVTLDRQVQFRSVGGLQDGLLEGMIVEIKHNGTRPQWWRPLRKRLGLERALRFSKFARSMKQLNRLLEREDPK